MTFLKALGLVALLTPSILHADKASQIFINAKVYTANPASPWADAIAINGEKILAVGSEQHVKTFIDSNTQIHQLDGKLVMPGIIDAHTHPGMVARSLGSLLLPEVNNQKELLNAVKKLIEENSDRDIIVGGYWENGLFDKKGPHKKLLDAIDPHKPVILFEVITQHTK